jgi:hypothetical protein
MEADERQKLRMKARQRAIERLKIEFSDRFEEIYNEELQSVGISRLHTYTKVKLS